VCPKKRLFSQCGAWRTVDYKSAIRITDGRLVELLGYLKPSTAIASKAIAPKFSPEQAFLLSEQIALGVAIDPCPGGLVGAASNVMISGVVAFDQRGGLPSD
jgi:hypothetical protein